MIWCQLFSSFGLWNDLLFLQLWPLAKTKSQAVAQMSAGSQSDGLCARQAVGSGSRQQLFLHSPTHLSYFVVCVCLCVCATRTRVVHHSNPEIPLGSKSPQGLTFLDLPPIIQQNRRQTEAYGKFNRLRAESQAEAARSWGFFQYPPCQKITGELPKTFVQQRYMRTGTSLYLVLTQPID